MPTASCPPAPARSGTAGVDCYWPRAILCLDLSAWPATPGPRDGATGTASVWSVLSEFSADIESAGSGKIFVDVTHGQRRHGTPEQMARCVQARIAALTGGWSCAIGVGGTRLGARYASTLATPGGVVVIAPWESRERLRDVPVQRLFATGARIAAFLAGHDLSTCGQVAALPSDLFVRRFGVVGRQLWLACRGLDTGAAVRDLAPPKVITQSRILPPRTVGVRTLESYLRHLCDRVSSRMRRLDMHAARLHVGLRYAAPMAGIDAIVSLADVAPDGQRWFEMARTILRDRGEPVLELRVTAMLLENRSGQLELFTPDEVSALRPATGVDRGGDLDRQAPDAV